MFKILISKLTTPGNYIFIPTTIPYTKNQSLIFAFRTFPRKSLCVGHWNENLFPYFLSINFVGKRCFIISVVLFWRFKKIWLVRQSIVFRKFEPYSALPLRPVSLFLRYLERDGIPRLGINRTTHNVFSFLSIYMRGDRKFIWLAKLHNVNTFWSFKVFIKCLFP